ncbi:MAG: nucleotidyl transferase AbiEii/AbiGii toxin family protein [Candidatus Ancillula sp.]|jgi:predicted nucleotidyltransferase component of viral defense system|nr:nucleotidyl transferase AbiEii/AbiGii toxin family protein [Candidatus Ancillula sp.]
MTLKDETKSLRARIKNVSQSRGLDGQLVMQNYMLERFLVRLSQSDYREQFILKGGLLLASIIGIDNRYTRDIDAVISGFEFTEKELMRAVTEICSIDAGDGVAFEFKKIGAIREEDDYSGYRITLNVNYGNMSIPIKLDISTGDVITPGAIEQNYKLLLEDSVIRLRSYNLETVLAEKLNTTLDRYLSNTRMRDYYDIYIIWKLKRIDLNKVILFDAMNNTAKARGNIDVYSDWQNRISTIVSDGHMHNLWTRYAEKYSYTRDIGFDETCESVGEVLKYANI